MSDGPHSAIYFGDSRDHWWHADFIELMARRLSIARFRRVLDVGCGYGHWARVWMPHLSPGTSIVGIDPEERSLAEAARRNEARRAALGRELSFAYEPAKVEALPFADGAFDLVTAQTVLIHVPDVARAIAEMHRVLAPGGLLLLAEPNNLAGAISALVDRPDFDDDRLLRAFELEVRIERGKARLGEGHNSVGEVLAPHFDAARFSSVASWLCDRSSGLRPPYDGPGPEAEIAQLRDFFARGWHGRPPEDARRYYLAGGGDDARFDALWAAGLAHDAWRLDEIAAGRYASAWGHVFHLFAATKAGVSARSPSDS